ncbi:MAG: M48 family metalloprotease [Acidobacteria bacterium]|nr:M48 family metalloprotease [Acidobacteriota bacterium]
MRLTIALLVTTVVAACATNPVTGKREFNLMSEAEELAIGQQVDAEVRREMGVYQDTDLQRYVSDIGMRLARDSHRPNLPWTFTVVDNAAINAFAVPGGYVYITRGILPYLGDESELAGVLGHEIGHVTARHAAQQYSRQAGGGLGLAILSIFVPQAAPFTDLSSMGLGILFLKYGRDDELEADRLGMEYAAHAGWDPSAVPRFLSTLARVDAMSERGVPNWLSTHPDPGSRVGEAENLLPTYATGAATARNRDEYLRTIEGIVVGDSLEQGIVRGSVFLHPMLRIGLDFPEGWEVFNSPEQVMAREPGTQHYMLLQQVDQPRGRGIEEVAQNAMRSAGFSRLDGAPARVGGLEAYIGTYRGSVSGAGRVLMRAAHIAMGRQVYVAAGFAPEAEFDRVDRVVEPAVRSFRELSASEASRIRPNVLSFYTVREGDSWQSIAQRAGQGITSAATLAIMNGYDVSTQPEADERVKVVVGG